LALLAIAKNNKYYYNNYMRIDKYLKVSRLIKRREVAKQMCDASLVEVNDKICKPSTEVNIGDKIKITSLTGKTLVVIIKDIVNHCPIDQTSNLFEVISE